MEATISKFMRFAFIITVILALAVPTPVLAQDVEPTQEPEATEVVTEVATEAPVEEATEAPTEAATEAPPVEETAAPTEAPAEVETESVAEVVEVLAEEEVILLDENGNPLPLASAAAEAAITNADPWFIDPADPTMVIAYQADCTGWVAPAPYAGGVCIVSATPIQAAIDAAPEGATVNLVGTFNETVTIQKSITLDGGGVTTIEPLTIPSTNGSATTVGVIYIDGSGSDAVVHVVLKGLLIDGLNLDGSYDPGITTVAGVYVNDAEVEMINNAIQNFLSENGLTGAGVVFEDSSALVINSGFVGNTVGIEANDSTVNGSGNEFINNGVRVTINNSSVELGLSSAWTDAEDYAPGSVVTFAGDNAAGAGYLPGEIVVVEVTGPNGFTASCEAVVNDLGAWSCSITLLDSAEAVGSYTYIVNGITSGITVDGSFTDGRAITTVILNPTTVAPGATISAHVFVELGYGSDWKCTKWEIGNSSTPLSNFENADHDNHEGYVGWPLDIDDDTFNMTAPTTPGTYNVYFYAYPKNDCTEGTFGRVVVAPRSALYTMTGAITVNKLPGSVSINNLPGAGVAKYGGGFTATYTKLNSGAVTLSSNTPAVCTTSGNNVSYVGVGTCSLHTYVPADATHEAASSDQTFSIGEANASCSVTPYDVPYNGIAHKATGFCTGVGGVNLSDGLDLSHTEHTNAGTYASDYWTFTDTTGNYNDIAAVTITNEIDKANQVTLTVTGPTDLTYGSAAMLSASGGSGTGALSFSAGSSTGCSVSGTTLSVTNVSGTCAITATRAGDSNYNPITTTAHQVNLVAKTIAVTPDPSQSKVYGTSNPLTYTYTSDLLEAGDSFSGALARAAGENVGPYAFTLGTLTAGSNYTLTLDPEVFTITQRPITVTANPSSKVWTTVGDPLPFTYVITSGSLVSGDVLTGALSRIPGEAEGVYAITQDTLDNPNYAITFVSNTFTIYLTAGQKDTDVDGIKDDVDNCVYDPNPNQLDSDEDGVGDVCDETPFGNLQPLLVPVTGGMGFSPFNCNSTTILRLPTSDFVMATSDFCGMDGELLEQLKETLPADLPAGVAYAFGMNLTVLDGLMNTVDYVPDPGRLTYSFAIPAELKDSEFTVYFWDVTLNQGLGDWVELPVYAENTDGTPVISLLHPDDTTEIRTILEGVQVTGEFLNRVEFVTNFPGLFILAIK